MRWGPAGPPTARAGASTVEPVGQTDILAVTAEADEPELATRMANTFAQAALDARAAALRPGLDALETQLRASSPGRAIAAHPSPSTRLSASASCAPWLRPAIPRFR